MLWEEFYEKSSEWAPSTTASRMSKLETFGPPEEIIEVIIDIGFDDEAAAGRLLKKATAAGVKFTGEQLGEVSLSCRKDILEAAIRFSADRFTAEDLEALESVSDFDLLENLAKIHHIPLPKFLREDVQWDRKPLPPPKTPTRAEITDAYRLALNYLLRAQKSLVQSHKMAVCDIGSRDRAISIAKLALFAEAEPLIGHAREILEALDSPIAAVISPANTSLSMKKRHMFADVFWDSSFSDRHRQRQIRSVIKNVETACREIEDTLKRL